MGIHEHLGACVSVKTAAMHLVRAGMKSCCWSFSVAIRYYSKKRLGWRDRNFRGGDKTEKQRSGFISHVAPPPPPPELRFPRRIVLVVKFSEISPQRADRTIMWPVIFLETRLLPWGGHREQRQQGLLHDFYLFKYFKFLDMRLL